MNTTLEINVDTLVSYENLLEILISDKKKNKNKEKRIAKLF
jgi:hypothetical protein